VGTASLIAGIGLMMIGFAVIAQGFLGTYFTTAQFFDSVLFNVIIGIPLIVLGAYFLKQYDIAKKKEAEPKKDIQYKTQPEWNLKKSPILKGVIIGIIAVSIIFGGIFVSMYHSFVVSTSGMEPELQIFDLIRYDEIPFNEIKIGDIIVYYSPSEQDKVIVHRVSAITNEDPLTIRTKGDARPTSIPGTDFPITKEEYIGKIVTIVPGGGHIAKVFAPPFNIIILVAAFVIPIVIMKIRERKSKNS